MSGRSVAYPGGKKVANIRAARIAKVRAENAVPADLQEAVSAPSTEAVRKWVEAGLCPICGAGPFRLLAAHTNQAHAIDKYALRDMAGLTYNAVVSPAMTAIRSQRAIEQGLPEKGKGKQGSGPVKRRSKAARQKLRDNGRRSSLKARMVDMTCKMCGISYPVPPQPKPGLLGDRFSASHSSTTCSESCSVAWHALRTKETSLARLECEVDGCERGRYTKAGLCKHHHMETLPLCSIDDCEDPQFASDGLCCLHHRRMTREEAKA